MSRSLAAVITGGLLAWACTAPAAGVPQGVEAPPAARRAEGLPATLDALRSGLRGVQAAARAGDVQAAARLALRVYLDHYEAVETLYGSGGARSAPGLSPLVTSTETEFHALLHAREPAALTSLADTLAARMDRIEEVARAAGVDLGPFDVAAPAEASAGPVAVNASTPEVRAILDELDGARRAYEAGRPAESLAAVEHAYLEGFEPLESRLPAPNVKAIESLVHLRLRPQLARGAAAGDVLASFTALERALGAADEALARGGSSWFGVFNAFVIIVREGLEAVLLIGAILAYLSATGAAPVHRRRVLLGAAAGVGASFATWILARTLIPVSGADRELIEGVTALIAVGVLLYVSHWLFQKTYIHDWKQYLRDRVGRAVSTGSALAMTALAFAAVFREGFETVLFYQALLYDVGPGAVAGGFAPGFALILLVGLVIVKFGVRLPLRTLFGATNAILLYLAFVFLGKGLYNLQEAGLFSPVPVGWLPDHEALRQVVGLYPVAQTVLAQTALLVLLVMSYVFYRRRAALLAGRVAAGAS